MGLWLWGRVRREVGGGFVGGGVGYICIWGLCALDWRLVMGGRDGWVVMFR